MRCSYDKKFGFTMQIRTLYSIFTKKQNFAAVQQVPAFDRSLSPSATMTENRFKIVSNNFCDKYK